MGFWMIINLPKLTIPKLAIDVSIKEYYRSGNFHGHLSLHISTSYLLCKFLFLQDEDGKVVHQLTNISNNKPHGHMVWQ